MPVEEKRRGREEREEKKYDKYSAATETPGFFNPFLTFS